MAAVLLAAGASRRLGQPKQLLPLANGAPLVRAMACRLLDAGCAPVVVVLGAHADAVEAALQGCDANVYPIRHADWAEGMGSSIAAGVRALVPLVDTGATAGDGAGVLIAACDMPAVQAPHLRALQEAAVTPAGVRRAASAYVTAEGEHIVGIPAVFPWQDAEALQALNGDRGARMLLRDTAIPLVNLDGGALDLDTPADVARWQQSV